METVKYLCEFFFCNGWHFLGLILVCFAISPKKTINNNCPVEIIKKEKEEN